MDLKRLNFIFFIVLALAACLTASAKVDEHNFLDSSLSDRYRIGSSSRDEYGTRNEIQHSQPTKKMDSFGYGVRPVSRYKDERNSAMRTGSQSKTQYPRSSPSARPSASSRDSAEEVSAKRASSTVPSHPWIEESTTEEMTPEPMSRAPQPSSAASESPRPRASASSLAARTVRHSSVSSSSSAAPQRRPSSAPVQNTKDPASLQWMITQRMRRTLVQELEYLPSEVDQMDPQVAAVVIKKGLKRPAAGMPVSWQRNRRLQRKDPRENEARRVEIPIKAIVLSPLYASKFAFLLPFRAVNVLLKPVNKCSETVGYVATVAASTAVLVILGLLWTGTVEVSQDSISASLDLALKVLAAVPKKLAALTGQLALIPSKISSKRPKKRDKKRNKKRRNVPSQNRSSRSESKNYATPSECIEEFEYQLSSKSDTWLDSAIDSLIDRIK